MNKILAKVNRWYDNIKEPWRFLFALVVVNVSVQMLVHQVTFPFGLIAVVLLFVWAWSRI